MPQFLAVALMGAWVCQGGLNAEEIFETMN